MTGLITILLLPAAVQGLCRLQDCANKPLPNCSKFDFNQKSIYRPIGPPKSFDQDPNHLFNLIYAQPDCTQVILNPGIHDSTGFSYYLDVICRSSRTFSVYLAFEAYFHRGGLVACIRRNNISLWMGKNCGIFARERIRLNFLPDQDRLVVEDLSRHPAGDIEVKLMLVKDEERPADGRCNCSKIEQFQVAFERCYGKLALPNGGNLYDYKSVQMGSGASFALNVFAVIIVVVMWF